MKKSNYVITLIGILILIQLVIGSPLGPGMLQQAYAISRTHGTVLTDNWWAGLNWIKNNTPECSVIATYWDPGHFITTIAERYTVFGGTSQNLKMIKTVEGNLTEEEMKKYAGHEKYTYETFSKNGQIYTNITTARIQDIGTTLYTDNESQAVDILRKYKLENCSEPMYYIASADLIGKSHWWTYFATWNPVNKGKAYQYAILRLQNAEPLPGQDAIKYIYPLGRQQSFVLYQKNNSIDSYLKQGNNFLKVEKTFYFTKNMTGKMNIQKDAQVKGTIWMDPSKRRLIFVPSELQNSLFTRMFLFNGAGLEHFKLIKNWGGEIKLFKVDFSNSTSV